MLQTAITSAQATFLNPAPATLNVTVRKSVYDLTDAEVETLRKAYAALQAINDNRGYQFVASIHGLNQYLCPHGSPFFLIWHRPYVLMFEQALQAVSPGIALPYWDWTSKRAQKEGLPAIFTDKTYKDSSTGKQVPNPLYKAAISYSNPDYKETIRNPANPASLGRLETLVQIANRQPTYDLFRPAVESPHNGLHGWVGGTMGIVTYAAFDPVFWAHHCFVEKLFCDWQDRNQGSIPSSIAGQVLVPFKVTTDNVWNYKTLGYRYAPENQNELARPVSFAVGTSSTNVATFDLSKVPEEFEHAHLHFVKTSHPSESFEVRVFLNEAAPNASTPQDNNPNYAGSFYTFGHGGCTGDEGHCDVPPVPENASHFITLRPEHHLTPKRMTLDITKALRKAKASASKSKQGAKLKVDIILVDAKGKELPTDSLEYEMLTLDAV